MGKPLLSVIIISHNQKEVLRRCIDSVLAQRTTFPMEVIVSDDRSTDVTREMLESEYKGRVLTTYCNTDEYEPHYTLERAGYNRLNGLKIARGKYVIHVDGDDVYIGDDVFQKQVETLEQHPECSLCVQNYRIADSANIDRAEIALDQQIFKDNPIVSAAEFITLINYVHNSACCMRKECLDVSLFIPLDGKTYDDMDITYRYMGYNKVALIDHADFVYVQNPNSFCHTTKSIDWTIIAMSNIQCMSYVPQLSMTVLQKHYNSVWALAKLAWKRVRVTDSLIEYFKDIDMFIFKVFDNHYSLKNRLRVTSIILWLIPIRFWKMKCSLSWKVLYKLAIK